jgi:hypothetical protein
MKIVLLIALVALTSCAQMAVNKRMKELHAKLDPMLGQPEETMVLQYGAPARVDEVAGVKIYRYHQSYGTRSTASANYYANPYAVNGYGNGQSWETYDSINLYFKDGIFIKWDGYVQR